MIMSLPSLKVTVLLYIRVLIWSLLGVKNKPGSRPHWSPLGVQFKISDEHPSIFYMGVPPFPGMYLLLTRN